MQTYLNELKMPRKSTSFFFLLLLTVIVKCNDSTNQTRVYLPGMIHHRQKRHLVFPEGSSLQLVFCLTTPLHVLRGNFFSSGYTASLAWQLPSKLDDLSFLELFKNGNPPANKRKDENLNTTVPIRIKLPDDWNDVKVGNFGRIKWKQWGGIKKNDGGNWKNKLVYNSNIQTRNKTDNSLRIPGPYYKPAIPVAYKRLTKKEPVYSAGENAFGYSQSEYKREDWNVGNNRVMEFPMKVKWKFPDYYTTHMHRRTRRSLFDKIQKLLSGNQINGHECVQKFICEVNNLSSDHRGGFLEEIFKAIFRWRTFPVFDIPDDSNTQHYKDYDKATRSGDCQSYKNCQLTLFEEGKEGDVDKVRKFFM